MGDLMEGFLRYQFGGLIFGGAYIYMEGLIFGILPYISKDGQYKCGLQTAADHCFHHANENVTQIVPLLSNPENNY